MLWFRSTPLPDPASDPHVLRIRPSPGYGDHLMNAAVIEGLKAERPELRIFLAARHPELFRHNPHVERVLDGPRLQKHDPGLYETFKWLRPRQPDQRRLQVEGHLIDDLYTATGVAVRERPRQPRIYLTPAEERWGEARVSRLPGPRIAVVPFGKGTVRLPNKVYPAEQWEALTRTLGQMAGTLLHLGTRKEGPLAHGARDFRDIGYRRMAAVLRHCDLLVTHVSGIMHLAAAVRTPAVVIYGAAEHPAISGYPWNYNLYTPIECGPCWLETSCAHHSCMRSLSPARVAEEVRAVLRGERQPGELNFPARILRDGHSD
jgi:ADP-heptose:LPS heptosyltransferase